MATQPVTLTDLSQSHGGRPVAVAAWGSLATGDVGAAHEAQGAGPVAAAVQVSGSFGGATIVLQKSNDGITWVTCKDTAGADVSFTAAGMAEISTAARYLRPSVSGGASVSLAMSLCLRG